MIPFKFNDRAPDRLITHIEECVEKILPDLKRIVKLFWEANWGEGVHQESPQVTVIISLNALSRKDGSGRSYIPSLLLYSDSTDEVVIHAQIDEILELNYSVKSTEVGVADTKKEDWF